jgi:hypothetical protein
MCLNPDACKHPTFSLSRHPELEFTAAGNEFGLHDSMSGRLVPFNASILVDFEVDALG